MAYGKIKCQTITWDNSGSDTDINVSTIPTAAQVAAKADLASPTFTGTPTVPGYAPLASPALTGTATAVNLTLSGTLTVNGTTTTVASTNTTITDNLLELNSGASSNANDSGIIIERGSTGDNAIFAWDESADKFIVGTTTGTASSTGDITIAAGGLVAGTIEDSKGDVRKIPQNAKTANYTLLATDAGKHILCNTASITITYNPNTFDNGDAITIVNNTTGDVNIHNSAGTNMQSTLGNGNRVLASRGMATILTVDDAANGTGYISGTGLT